MELLSLGRHVGSCRLKVRTLGGSWTTEPRANVRSLLIDYHCFSLLYNGCACMLLNLRSVRIRFRPALSRPLILQLRFGSDQVLVGKQLLPGCSLKLRLRQTDFVDASNLLGESVNRRCTVGPALDENAAGLRILRPECLDSSNGLGEVEPLMHTVEMNRFVSAVARCNRAT